MRRKRMKTSEMSCAAIHATPIDNDWDGEKYAETWEYVEASRCEKCRKPIVGSGGDSHGAVTGWDDDCKGHVPSTEGPMMNYWYPCDIDDTERAAKRIVDLPLCVVIVDGKTGLALTGGGMDLSWEICEAFMRLGFLPPLHFADLPAMAGRGTSSKDKWIARGCMRSCKVAASWAKRTGERVREMLARAEARKAHMVLP